MDGGRSHSKISLKIGFSWCSAIYFRVIIYERKVLTLELRVVSAHDISFAERPRSATTPAGATRAHARGVTAGVVVL
jgi:hypothetical protein